MTQHAINYLNVCLSVFFPCLLNALKGHCFVLRLVDLTMLCGITSVKMPALCLFTVFSFANLAFPRQDVPFLLYGIFFCKLASSFFLKISTIAQPFSTVSFIVIFCVQKFFDIFEIIVHSVIYT